MENPEDRAPQKKNQLDLERIADRLFEALGIEFDRADVQAWRELVESVDGPDRKRHHLRALVGVRRDDVADVFRDYLRDEDAGVRAVAVRGLRGRRDAIQELLEASEDAEPEVRMEAIDALAAIDEPRARWRIARMAMDDPDPDVRRRAASTEALVLAAPSGRVEDVQPAAATPSVRDRFGRFLASFRRWKDLALEDLQEWCEKFNREVAPGVLRGPTLSHLGDSRSNVVQVVFYRATAEPSESEGSERKVVGCPGFVYDHRSGRLDLELELPPEWRGRTPTAAALVLLGEPPLVAEASEIVFEDRSSGRLRVVGEVPADVAPGFGPDHIEAWLVEAGSDRSG